MPHHHSTSRRPVTVAWTLRLPLDHDPSRPGGAWVRGTRQVRDLSAAIEQTHLMRLSLLLTFVVFMAARPSLVDSTGLSLTLLSMIVATPAFAGAYLRHQINRPGVDFARYRQCEALRELQQSRDHLLHHMHRAHTLQHLCVAGIALWLLGSGSDAPLLRAAGVLASLAFLAIAGPATGSVLSAAADLRDSLSGLPRAAASNDGTNHV